MFCQSCGAKLEETLKVCPSCGANVYQPEAVIQTDQLASRWDRLLATAIDGLAMLACIVPAIVYVFMAEANGASFTYMDLNMNMNVETSMLEGMGVAVLCVLLLFTYQTYLLAKYGVTIGKRFAKIKIVTLDEQNPGFFKAVFMRSFVNSLLTNFIPFYGLVDVLFIFRADKRCIHDLMAGTKVVNTIY